jgi:hypothetical protein
MSTTGTSLAITRQPLGSIHGTTSFPSELLLDDKQIKERIEELERTKTDLVSLLQYLWANKQWIGLNQDPTNYCWCFAVIHAIMILRALSGEPFKRLSPFSVACIVKGFRNNGGWGGEANEQCVKEGVATEEFWPFGIPGSGKVQSANMAAFDRKYLAPSRANAALHKVTEFWELEPNNDQQKLSALCIPLPVHLATTASATSDARSRQRCFPTAHTAASISIRTRKTVRQTSNRFR